MTKLTDAQAAALKTVLAAGGYWDGIVRAHCAGSKTLLTVVDRLVKKGLIRRTNIEVPVYVTERDVESDREMNLIIAEHNARQLAAIERGDVRYQEGYSFQPTQLCPARQVGDLIRVASEPHFEVTAAGCVALDEHDAVRAYRAMRLE